MKKNIGNFLVNLAVFWIVADSFPGFKAPYGAVSRFYAGVVFGLTMVIAEWLRSAFGLPKLIIVKIIFGTLLSFGGFWLVNNFASNFFSFGPSYIGGGDLIFFSMPKILVLQDINLVLLFAGLIANICSIIIFKLKK